MEAKEIQYIIQVETGKPYFVLIYVQYTNMMNEIKKIKSNKTAHKIARF